MSSNCRYSRGAFLTSFPKYFSCSQVHCFTAPHAHITNNTSVLWDPASSLKTQHAQMNAKPQDAFEWARPVSVATLSCQATKDSGLTLDQVVPVSLAPLVWMSIGLFASPGSHILTHSSSFLNFSACIPLGPATERCIAMLRCNTRLLSTSRQLHDGNQTGSS